MNQLHQLIWDLNLDEFLVLRRINSEWQTDYRSAMDVPDDKYANAVALVMQVLRQDCELALETVKLKKP